MSNRNPFADTIADGLVAHEAREAGRRAIEAAAAAERKHVEELRKQAWSVALAEMRAELTSLAIAVAPATLWHKLSDERDYTGIDFVETLDNVGTVEWASHYHPDGNRLACAWIADCRGGRAFGLTARAALQHIVAGPTFAGVLAKAQARARGNEDAAVAEAAACERRRARRKYLAIMGATLAAAAAAVAVDAADAT